MSERSVASVALGTFKLHNAVAIAEAGRGPSRLIPAITFKDDWSLVFRVAVIIDRNLVTGGNWPDGDKNQLIGLQIFLIDRIGLGAVIVQGTIATSDRCGFSTPTIMIKQQYGIDNFFGVRRPQHDHRRTLQDSADLEWFGGDDTTALARNFRNLN